MESFDGSSGDICSGHAADVDDVDKKLAEGLSRPLSFDAEESVSSVGVNVYCVSSSSIEVASRLSKLDDPGFLVVYPAGPILPDSDL